MSSSNTAATPQREEPLVGVPGISPGFPRPIGNHPGSPPPEAIMAGNAITRGNPYISPARARMQMGLFDMNEMEPSRPTDIFEGESNFPNASPHRPAFPSFAFSPPGHRHQVLGSPFAKPGQTSPEFLRPGQASRLIPKLILDPPFDPSLARSADPRSSEHPQRSQEGFGDSRYPLSAAANDRRQPLAESAGSLFLGMRTAKDDRSHAAVAESHRRAAKIIIDVDEDGKQIAPGSPSPLPLSQEGAQGDAQFSDRGDRAADKEDQGGKPSSLTAAGAVARFASIEEDRLRALQIRPVLTPVPLLAATLPSLCTVAQPKVIGQDNKTEATALLDKPNPPNPIHVKAVRFLPPSFKYGQQVTAELIAEARILHSASARNRDGTLTIATAASSEQTYPPLLPHRAPAIHYVTPANTLLSALPTASFYHHFRRKGWLNDSVVEAYLFLIECQMVTAANKSTKPANTTLGPTAFSQVIVSREQGNYLGLSNGSPVGFNYFESLGIKLFETLLFVMPWNIGLSHWVAVVIDFPAKAIYVLDSLQPEVPDARRAVFEYVLSWMAEMHHAQRGIHLDQDQWTYQYPYVQQQTNGYDCGIFTLQFIEAVCRLGSVRLAMETVLTRDMGQARIIMTLELAQQRLASRPS